MQKTTYSSYTKIIFTLALLLLTACQPGAGSKTLPHSDTLQPKEMATSKSQSAELKTPISVGNAVDSPEEPLSPEGGISIGELRESTPLAPINLRASLTSKGVILEWDPAPPADFTHSYSDRIAHYNIYRSPAPDSDFILLAETDQPFFIDQDLISGAVYYYAVSAVHEGPVEGLKTEMLKWTQP